MRRRRIYLSHSLPLPIRQRCVEPRSVELPVKRLSSLEFFWYSLWIPSVDSSLTIWLHWKHLPLDLLDTMEFKELTHLRQSIPIPHETFLKAILALKEWESAQSFHSSPRPMISFPPQPYALIEHEIYCNTDASWRTDHKSTGLAWLFTDLASVELNRGSYVQQFISSSCMG